MGEGLKLVNEIFDRAKKQHGVPADTYLGINAAIVVLSDPQNADLWQRASAYCDEEAALSRPVVSEEEILEKLYALEKETGRTLGTVIDIWANRLYNLQLRRPRLELDEVIAVILAADEAAIYGPKPEPLRLTRAAAERIADAIIKRFGGVR